MATNFFESSDATQGNLDQDADADWSRLRIAIWQLNKPFIPYLRTLQQNGSASETLFSSAVRPSDELESRSR